LLIAPCQGGALHYLDCQQEAKKKNGVKDLDVYCFYAADRTVPWPYRDMESQTSVIRTSATTRTSGPT
jgi:hypothetical protein